LIFKFNFTPSEFAPSWVHQEIVSFKQKKKSPFLKVFSMPIIKIVFNIILLKIDILTRGLSIEIIDKFTTENWSQILPNFFLIWVSIVNLLFFGFQWSYVSIKIF
jgi:hypothetical protein